ncbi:hypothetical protein CLCR_11004 [Cladophialophora carrionii]|uniref:Uncharacterized protein n=1 Tax=Cladophialophora carrionii TaxID=86049 RepID=A0A1C1CVL2_9EURO|nr:hypothetical protein CLCR_11004 [Cladophialophora carrionii]
MASAAVRSSASKISNRVQYKNPSPETFAVATTVYGSALFILEQRRTGPPMRDRFLVAEICLGVVLGFLLSEGDASLVRILMSFTPWTLLGGQMLSLAVDWWWPSTRPIRLEAPAEGRHGLFYRREEKKTPT